MMGSSTKPNPGTMTTIKRLKMNVGDDLLWYVFLQTAIGDRVAEITRSEPLFRGTADECSQWISEHRNELEAWPQN